MKQIIIVFASSFVFSCSNSSSGSGQNNDSNAVASANTIDGTWVYVNPSSTESAAKGLGAVISGSKISLIAMYMYQQPSGYKVYFRKSEGTFIKDGEKLTISYTYETCSPLSTEVAYVKINGDNATISANNGSLIYTMKRYANNDPSSPLNMTMIEDTGCTILSKLQKLKNTRSVASDNVGSILLLKNLEK